MAVISQEIEYANDLLISHFGPCVAKVAYTLIAFADVEGLTFAALYDRIPLVTTYCPQG